MRNKTFLLIATILTILFQDSVSAYDFNLERIPGTPREIKRYLEIMEKSPLLQKEKWTLENKTLTMKFETIVKLPYVKIETANSEIVIHGAIPSVNGFLVSGLRRIISVPNEFMSNIEVIQKEKELILILSKT